MSEEPVSDESVTDIIRKFKNHPSLIKIKLNHQGYFSFSAVELKDVYRELDPSKAIQQNDIPINNREQTVILFLNNFNEDISLQGFLTFSKRK